MRNESRARVMLICAVAVTFLLYLLPYGRYVAYPLVLLSTYAHEMGHGLTAMLLGGAFDSLVIEPDGSGVAFLRIPENRVLRAATSAGGLLGPAIFAAVFFRLAKRARTAQIGLVMFSALCFASLLLVVRSAFGIVFVSALGVATAYVGTKSRSSVAQNVVAFLAVQLSLSIFSRADYLFTESTPAGPSDVAQMANALWLPYWFWGGVCGATSIVMLAHGVASFLKKGSP